MRKQVLMVRKKIDIVYKPLSSSVQKKVKIHYSFNIHFGSLNRKLGNVCFCNGNETAKGIQRNS